MICNWRCGAKFIVNTLTAVRFSFTATTSQSSWFQIKNTHYNKCLALREQGRRPAPLFALNNCDASSTKQSWQLTSSNQLKLSYNGNCLTYSFATGIKLQPCNTSNQNQQWLCVGNKLRLKSKLLYLFPFMYSGMPYGYNIRPLWYSCSYKSCFWSRFDTGLSVCSNGTSYS